MHFFTVTSPGGPEVFNNDEYGRIRLHLYQFVDRRSPALCHNCHQLSSSEKKIEKGKEVGTDSVRGEKQVNIFAVVRQILLTPDHFFKQISSDSINLWQTFTLLTIGGIIFTIAIIISMG